ncbi:unnamed protein product, partial [Iphiclides podalirius]
MQRSFDQECALRAPSMGQRKCTHVEQLIAPWTWAQAENGTIHNKLVSRAVPKSQQLARPLNRAGQSPNHSPDPLFTSYTTEHCFGFK